MSTFSLGTTTSSKVMPLVSLALCPMLISFLPGVTPGVSPSTMNPVNALLAGHLGSAPQPQGQQGEDDPDHV